MNRFTRPEQVVGPLPEDRQWQQLDEAERLLIAMGQGVDQVRPEDLLPSCFTDDELREMFTSPQQAGTPSQVPRQPTVGHSRQAFGVHYGDDQVEREIVEGSQHQKRQTIAELFGFQPPVAKAPRIDWHFGDLGDLVPGRPLTCPNGHTLVPFVTTGPDFGCDVHGDDLAPGSEVMSCRLCNFDACKQCFQMCGLEPRTVTAHEARYLACANVASFEEQYNLEFYLRRARESPDKVEELAADISENAHRYIQLSAFGLAERTLLEGQAFARELVGPRHELYARNLGELGRLYQEMGDYGKARSAFEDARQVMMEALGPQHLGYAVRLVDLARFHAQLAEFPEAESLFMEALSIFKESSEEFHFTYSEGHHQCLLHLAQLCADRGALEQAEALYEESALRAISHGGRRQSDYAMILEKRARFCQEMGLSQKAEEFCQEAMGLRLEIHGRFHPNYATSMLNMAILYRDTGKFDKAEPLFQTVRELCVQTVGDQHPHYAAAIAELGLLYQELRALDKAETLFVESSALLRQVLGVRHPQYAGSLFQLAKFYHEQGSLQEAELHYEQCLQLRKEVLGDRHPAFAATLSSLAVVYSERGELQQAEILHHQVLKLQEETLGKQHQAYAESLSRLANLYERQEAWERALELHLEARDLRSNLLGNHHPQYAMSLLSIARVHLQLGSELIMALTFLEEASSIQRSLANRTMGVLPVRQRMHFVASLRQSLRGFVATLLQLQRQKPGEISQELLQNAFKATAMQKNLTYDSQALEEAAELREKRQQLAQLSLGDNGQKERLAKLQEEIDRLEVKSGRMTQHLLEPSGADLLDSIAAKLPVGSVLVEFVFCEGTFEGVVQKRYAAFVLGKSEVGPFLELLDCGPAKEINKEIDRYWRSLQLNDIQVGQSLPNKKGLAAGVSLWQRLLEPVTLLLQENNVSLRHLFLAPDSELAVLPFAALPVQLPKAGESPVYVVHMNFTLSYISAGRDLLRPSWDRLPVQAPLRRARIFADANFDKSPEISLQGNAPCEQSTEHLNDVNDGCFQSPGGQGNAPEGNELRPALQEINGELLGAASNHSSKDDQKRGLSRSCKVKRDPIRGDLLFEPLESSLLEAHRVQELLQAAAKVETFTGDSATAEELLRPSEGSPWVLHVATHGILLEPEEETDYQRLESLAQNKEPLLRCGLAMAGAAHWQKCGEGPSGIVTGLELRHMDLKGTKLVSLSACETGLGEILSGEGVIGLGRAVQLAGAESVLMSLWQVSDHWTAELLSKFYEGAVHSSNEPQPFHLAAALQAAMRMVCSQEAAETDYQPCFPGYWGAFLLQGAVTSIL